MTPDTLLPILRALECELHTPGTRQNRQRLSELLHPEFREFGRSGATYTRDEILVCLPAEAQPARIHAQDFVACELAEGLVLLTYRAAHVAIDAALERHALRSSVWKREASGWQMMFHQGTPTAAFVRCDN